MLAGSVAVHLLLWPLGDQLIGLRWGAPPIRVGGGVMEVSLLDPSSAMPDDEEAVPPEEPRTPDGKIVNLDRLTDERPPERDTEHLSEFDHRTDKETRAPNRRPTPGPRATQRGDRPDAEQGQSEQGSSSSRDTGRALPLAPQATGSEGSGEGSRPADAAVDEQGQLAKNAGSAGSLSPRGSKGLPNALRQHWGSPGSFDALGDDIEEGEENILNSKRYKYASFFNRVRNAVAEHWHPEVLHASRDPDGRIYGTKTRRTRLLIVLNPDGSLHDIRLDDSSDVPYLDEEAIRAVRAAQPFSNPPPGLVDPKTGLIEFGFAFIFEINKGTRIFRYQR